MSCPSLIKSSASQELFVSDQRCAVIHDEQISWLQTLDQNPKPLMDYLAKRKASRLGYYFEDLVAYWIEQKISGGYLESHVKVSDGSRDIGEFDFLFNSSEVEAGQHLLRQNVEHWETAIKFYLYTEGQAGKVSWYGPNANDTLAKKVERMTSHQARLSELLEGKAVLSGKGIDQVLPGIFLKGYLFYPVGLDLNTVDREVLGYQISDAHLKGWWLQETELSLLEKEEVFNNDLSWRIVPRLEWLAPRLYSSPSAVDKLMKIDVLITALRDHYAEARDSLLIAGFSINEIGQWQEKTRGFVVARTWPD